MWRLLIAFTGFILLACSDDADAPTVQGETPAATPVEPDAEPELPPGPPPPRYFAEAVQQYETLRWSPARCIGIPDRVPGFKVTRHREGTRTDLVPDTHVYVIYEEFRFDPSGESFVPGSWLVVLEGTHLPVYSLEHSVQRSRPRESYATLAGFGGGRFFRVHAWENTGAAGKALEVALRVAKLAHATLSAGTKK